MSEHDANRALWETARVLRLLDDPIEDAKPMTFSERQYRAREARGLMLDAAVADDVHRYRQRKASGLKLCDDMADQMQRQIDAHVDALAVKAGWPDFREGRREYRLLPHEIAQQDGGDREV